MYEVHIPDKVYHQAVEAAEANQMSLDKYVAEVLRHHFRSKDETALRLTPEQAAAVRKGQAEIKAGLGLTVEQVEKKLAENRAAWLDANQK